MIRGLLAAGLTAFLLTQISTGAAGKTVFKIATLAPDGSAWMTIFTEMNAEVEQATAGEVSFKAYPGGVLGDEINAIRKIKLGQIQGAGVTGMGMCQIYPDFRVISLPNLFSTYEQADAVIAKLEPFFTEQYAAAGYVVLGYPRLGFSFMFSSAPLRSLEDLRNSKVWVWADDPTMTAMTQAAGVNGVSLGIADVLTGLQTQLIQTVFNSPSGVIALQWHTKLKTMTDLPLTFSTGGLLVDKNAFDKLPADTQQRVLEIVGRHIRRLSSAAQQENEDARQVLRDRGIEFLPPSVALRTEFAAAADKTTAALMGKSISPEVVQRVRGLIGEMPAETDAP